MTAREFLNKYPRIDALVKAIVRECKNNGNTAEEGLEMTKRMLDKETGQDVPMTTVEAIWIA